MQLVPLTQALLDSAAAAAGADFEDNVQLISAESLSVTHLVTRNKKDFTNTPLTVLNPEEWLAIKEVADLEANLP